MAKEVSGPSDIESNFGTTVNGSHYHTNIYGDSDVQPAPATPGMGSPNFSGKQYDNNMNAGTDVSAPDGSTETSVGYGDFGGRGKGDNTNNDPSPSGKQY